MALRLEQRRELKAKLRSRSRLFSAWTSFAHPSCVEIMARIGVDFIGIDMEHSTYSYADAQAAMQAGQGEGLLCLPRIACHDQEIVKRVLDSGADGLIAPLVSSREEAERLWSWCAYPPQGRRNFGVARAQAYGVDYDAYTREWNRIFSFIIQIETKEGVENIDEILSFDGIDGVMIGPYDMSGSYGIPGQLDHATVREACAKVIASCKAHGKSCGTHLVETNESTVRRALEQGYTFLVLSSDLFVLSKWGEGVRQLISRI